MSDDLKVRERWFSDRLQAPATVVRWGVLGVPACGSSASSRGRSSAVR